VSEGQADVYAGDLDLAVGNPGTEVIGCFAFHIVADAAPETWARIANQFLLSNCLPVVATLRVVADELVECQVILSGVSNGMAARISGKLRQQVVIRTVELAWLARGEAVLPDLENPADRGEPEVKQNTRMAPPAYESRPAGVLEEIGRER
jgi:hypothetical protein